MLRLICVSFSAFLLLSTVGIQNVQAQIVGTAVRGAARGVQVLQGLARVQRGVQGVSRFNSLVGPQIMRIASEAGIVGVNLAQVIERLKHQAMRHYRHRLHLYILCWNLRSHNLKERCNLFHLLLVEII